MTFSRGSRVGSRVPLFSVDNAIYYIDFSIYLGGFVCYTETEAGKDFLSLGDRAEFWKKEHNYL